MKKKTAFGLRFKITAGVLLPLLIILSILAYVRHTNYRNLLIKNLQTSAANAGEIIEGSLQHAMLTNNFSTLEQIVDNIAKQPRVYDLFLLSKSGHVLISTEEDMAGTTIDLDDPTCQACHRHKAALRNENVVLVTGEQEKLFRNVNALENSQECQACHDPQSRVLGVLISDFDMTSIEQALAIDQRNSLLWFGGSIVLILLIVDLLMSRMVVGKLEQFALAVKRISRGDLDVKVDGESKDEIGDLARAFNLMADGLKENVELEQSLKIQTQQLQAQTARLSMLNTISATVNQSLNLIEILNSALDKVFELMRLKAGWIVLHQDQDDEDNLVTCRGLPREIALAHVHCTWNRCVCSKVLQAGKPEIFAEMPEHSCPTSEYFRQRGLVFRACVPLISKDRVLGVMSLVGDSANGVSKLTEGMLEMLIAIGRQIGMAVENASLYQELQQEEMLRRKLLERLFTVQEQERKRIALELHDQTGQPLTSLIMTLGVLADAQSLDEIHLRVQALRDMAAQVLKEVHDLSLELRPSVLDDLGLFAALRQHHKEYQGRFHIPVDFQIVGMDNGRLPSDVETALYRIVQEALTNVAKHAGAQNISVLLENRKSSVMLIVEDDGCGFDVMGVMDSYAREERLGLYGMRERASLLGGTLTIESTPNVGTTVFVEIPLVMSGENDEQDSAAGRR
ncbi:MAG: GAF domain-containing protein [Anaerolineae bacterium]|nr:GAF domain-containing protein [Anaerolineae bacterium]